MGLENNRSGRSSPTSPGLAFGAPAPCSCRDVGEILGLIRRQEHPTLHTYRNPTSILEKLGLWAQTTYGPIIRGRKESILKLDFFFPGVLSPPSFNRGVEED